MELNQRRSSLLNSVSPREMELAVSPQGPSRGHALVNRPARPNQPLPIHQSSHVVSSQHVQIPGVSGSVATGAVAASVTDQAAALRAAVAESKHNRARIEARGDQTRQLQTALQTALDQITKIEHEFARFKQAAEHDRAHYAAVLEENAQLRNRIAILVAEREDLLHGETSTHPDNSDGDESDEPRGDDNDEAQSGRFSIENSSSQKDMLEPVTLTGCTKVSESIPVSQSQQNLEDRDCEDDDGPFKQTSSVRSQLGAKAGKSKSQPLIGRRTTDAVKSLRTVASRSVSPSSAFHTQTDDAVHSETKSKTAEDFEQREVRTRKARHSTQEQSVQSKDVTASGALPPEPSMRSRSKSSSARAFIRRKSSFIGRSNKDVASFRHSRPSTLPLPFPSPDKAKGGQESSKENASPPVFANDENRSLETSPQKPFERALSVRLLRNDRNSTPTDGNAVLSDTTNHRNVENPASPSAKRRGERHALAPARRAMSANFRAGNSSHGQPVLPPAFQLRSSRDWSNRASSRFSASTFNTTGTTGTSGTESTTATTNTELRSSNMSSTPSVAKKRMSRKWSTCF